MHANGISIDGRQLLVMTSFAGSRTAHGADVEETHVPDTTKSADRFGMTATFGAYGYRAEQLSDNFVRLEPIIANLSRRDIELPTSKVRGGASWATESSVRQARWILVPLFGLWIAIAAANAIF